ncbi:hypothetical protein ACFRAR_15895 [Kitasatospora sp. NPDC056651]|uniref:hypothetical protein n=1 Tax=Kitasatospora sp. NPDC056651 TaxID=3345892 RepID=UPI00369E4FBB
MSTPTAAATARITLGSSHRHALEPGEYRVEVTHTTPDGSSLLKASRALLVGAPRFTCTAADVLAVHPAPGASGDFSLTLPHATLTSAVLPWARTASPPVEGRAVPWIALLVLTAADTPHPADPGTVALTPRTVGSLLTPETGVVTPLLPDVTTEEGKQLCHSVDVTVRAARALLPTIAELPWLTHSRTVAANDGGPGGDDPDWAKGCHSVVTANRLPRTAGAYTAVLVSLEGLQGYDLMGGPDAVPDGATAVRMAALWSWTFQAQSPTSDPHTSFFTLADRLAEDSRRDEGRLRLPAPPHRPANAAQRHTVDRLAAGAVPVTWRLPTGEPTPAWYRGPFTPLAVPAVAALATAADADAATAFWKDPGVHDIGYAAAFTLGQLLALADPHLKAAQHTVRRDALTAVHDSLRRIRTPRPSGDGPARYGARPGSLRGDLEATVAERTTITAIGENLGRPWSDRDAPSGPGSPGFGPREVIAALVDGARSQSHAKEFEEVVRTAAAAVAAVVDSHAPALRELLEGPGLLKRIPFHHLVPHEALLPQHSARFFQVDAQWLATVRTGAHHAGTVTALDGHLGRLCTGRARSLTRDPEAGCLIRSPLIAAWPDLIVEAFDAKGSPVAVDVSRPLPEVLMLLFVSGLPATLVLREPPHGLTMALDARDENGCYRLIFRAPRDMAGADAPVKAGESTGWEIQDIPARAAAPEVLHVVSTGTEKSLVGQLRAMYRAHELGEPTPADLALQLLNSAGHLTFQTE